MADKVLKTRILLKFATVDDWKKSELHLLKGELVFDETGKYKIGTGINNTKWADLPYGGAYAFISDAELNENNLPQINVNNYQAGTIVILTVDGEEKLFVAVERETSDSNNNTVFTKEWKEINSTNQEAVTELITEIVGDLKSTNIEGTTVAEQISTINDNYNNLIAAISTNTSNITDLDSRLNVVESDIQDISTEIEDLTNKIGNVPTGNNLQSEIELAQTTANSATNKANTLESELFENGSEPNNRTIKPSVLPSFVDDVIEGFVISDSDNYQSLYALTHEIEGDVVKVTGFFAAISENNQLTLRTTDSTTKYGLITAKTSAAISEQTITHSNTEYSLWNGNNVKLYKPVTDAIYVDIFTNNTYRWGGTQFVLVASDLAIGTTAGTAFEGDRGVAVEAGIATLTSKVDILDNTLVETNEKVNEHTSILASIMSTVESNDSTVQELIDAIRDDVDLINETIGDINEDGVEGNTIAEEIQALNNYIGNINRSIDSINTSVSALQISVSNLDSRVTTNEQNITALDSAIVTLQNKDTLLDAKDEELEAAINSLATTINTKLENSTSSIEEAIDAIESSIGTVPVGTTVEGQIESISNDLDVAKGDIETLETKISSDLEPRVAELESVAENHTVAITSIINQHEEDVNEIIASLGAVRESIDFKTVINNSSTVNGESYIDLGSNTLILDCGGAN